MTLRIITKVNKAGRMAEHCGRKGSKQQVAFDDDDAAADDDIYIMMKCLSVTKNDHSPLTS